MAEQIYYAGLIGCGDYLQWFIDALNTSKKLKVKSTFDLDKEKSKLRAGQLGAIPVEDADRIFADPEISVVMIFTPPWARTALFQKAVQTNKQIITTKPLASNYASAKEMADMVEGKVQCAVHYGRSGDAVTETLKNIFDEGEIGKLALYKEDWFHHFPTWNNWALDPEKNGGPFMDAMVHNLNKARYLMNREPVSLTYFSDNHVQNLKCNDTEGMKIDFEGNASAHLFITWAADLEVYNSAANDREHYGIAHYITDKGWYVNEVERPEGVFIKAHKEDQVKEWKANTLHETVFDQFVIEWENDQEVAPNIKMALEDIRLMELATKNQNSKLNLTAI